MNWSRILTALLFTGILWLHLYLTRFMYAEQIVKWHTLYLFTKVITYLCSIGLLLFILHQARQSIKKKTRLNALLLFMSSILSLFTIEQVFVFIPATESTATSLSCRNWILYYRKPINEQGFRDANWINKNSKAPHSIVFIGDSYTEGFGLNDTSLRFSNLVANKLGHSWESYNMGSAGAATTEELQYLQQLPVKPDILVWQYLFNDADDVCNESANSYPDLDMYQGLWTPGKWLIIHSYLANWFYFRWHHFIQFEMFRKYFVKCTASSAAMHKHYAQFDTLIAFCKKNDIKLVPVIIPYMNDIMFGSPIEDSVCIYLAKSGLHPIVMRHAAMQTDPSLRSVSKYDAQPGTYFSAIIADSIFNRIQETGP